MEGPFADTAVVVDLTHGQFRWRHRDLLIRLRRAVVQLERPIDQEHVEPEEAEHRPSARQQEHHAGGEAQATQHCHENQKAHRAQRTVRGQHRRKDRGFRARFAAGHVVGRHGAQYRESMARKTPRKKRPKKKGPRNPALRKSVRASLDKARKGKAAALKPPKKQLAADRKAIAGLTPPWTPAEIEEA